MLRLDKENSPLPLEKGVTWFRVHDLEDKKVAYLGPDELVAGRVFARLAFEQHQGLILAMVGSPKAIAALVEENPEAAVQLLRVVKTYGGPERWKALQPFLKEWAAKSALQPFL